MGPTIDVGKSSNVKMEGPSYTSNDNYAKELEDELMKYTDGSKVGQGQTPQVQPLVGQTKEGLHSVDLPTNYSDNAVDDVDITELNRLGRSERVDGQSHDTTESSSSFGSSGSDVNDSGEEASSGVHEDIMVKARRKKLTPHWKAFIEPIMWRCKWIELQIKYLDSLAKKYEKKLAKYSQQNHIQLENSAFEGLCAKSLPFNEKNLTDKVLKRKKRRRSESTTDLDTYTSTHNVFSYYGNKRTITEAASMDKGKVSAGLKVKVEELPGDEFLWAQPGEADDSMEHVLQKIMLLESQVGKMRSMVDNVINENAGKFSYVENLSFPISISPTSSSQNTTPSNGGKTVSSQFVTGHYDTLMPETASTSHEDVTGSKNLARFADALKNGNGDIVYTKKVKREKNNLAGLKSQPIEKDWAPNDEFGGSCDQLEEESDMPMESQPLRRSRSVARHTTTPPKSDVRRGRRRTCVGRGNPRFSS